MQKMMSIGTGEPVADEFIPLLLDQMAFEPERRAASGPAAFHRPPTTTSS